MSLESWFLVFAAVACCGGREFWFWLRLSSSAIERSRRTAADDVSFTRSLDALNSKMALDRRHALAESVDAAAATETMAANLS